MVFPMRPAKNIGNELQRLDEGEEPLDFAAMGAVLPGVFELRDRDSGHWYRVLYIPLEGLILCVGLL